MKTKLLLIFIFLCCFAKSNAQCTPDGSITVPGTITPMSSVPCIDKGAFYDQNVQFKNFFNVYFNGQYIPVDSIVIDSINNLPCGLTWATDKSLSIPANSYQSAENGCIRISGTTFDSIGQYRVQVWAQLKVNFNGSHIWSGVQQASAYNFLPFYVRLKNAGDICPNIDTNAVGNHAYCNSNIPLTLATQHDTLICMYHHIQLFANIGNGSGHYLYQWTPSAGLNCDTCPNPIANPNATTTYHLTVTDINSLDTVTGSTQISIETCAGIVELNGAKPVSVYPNPNSGKFRISANVPNKSALLELFNNVGQRLFMEERKGKEIQSGVDFNTGNLLPGLYMLKISVENEIFVGKVVVE